ncbi:glycosyltransferase family 4 protein [Krasilnikoviella flava]|uniref:Glycosyltransferase involved in cell wall bisynthesis n=1 Tax=Krasilnikoviella flava TaxID=526729 RepID=A0A1T5IEY5_9MICO|nr:glycosyltransferase family 4 protein [Krasilnikoviella flava]SKC37583.1 Glycosyltransferase involved in cell wall bisynthesis [Krasilnikoviella flava]
MRITHVVVTDAFAGVEAHVARLARAQADAGHDVAVVGGAAASMSGAAGDAVELRPGTTVAEARRSLAEGARPDVVHAHMTAAETAACLWAPVLARRVPLVVTRHFALVRGRSLAGRAVAHVIRRTVAAQIAISRYTRERIDGPSEVIVAGVEERPHPRVSALRSPVVLVASRLEPEKHVDAGVRAFAASGLAIAGWRLRIAGSGSLEVATKELVARFGLDRAVDLLGHRSDVAALMADASIFLAPTPGEHFGLSVLEAMASGVPVVADGSGGHVESLGRAGGPGLYATGDADDAGRRLRALAEDPALRDRYGAALQARQRAEFSLAHQAAATERVYRDVLP